MTRTPADDDLADDDQDITAKLPILSSAEFADEPPDPDDATAEYRMPPGAAAALQVDADGHWDLSDELVAVRDRIVSLEATLADTEIELTRLHARHDSLQSEHADLRNHSEAVSRDRDRLAEESLRWLASRQQLQDQLEQQRVEADTALLDLQQSLEQQQRTSAELQRQLEEQRQHREALQKELLTTQQQFAEQHASAAALARSMAQALLEKDDLQRSLDLGSERIEHLVSQVESEESNRRSAEQDNARLRQTVATERESLENTRRELSDREAQVGTLQDSVVRLREELGQLQVQLQELDVLAREQARELDGAKAANRELTEQIGHRDQAASAQAMHIADLSANVQRLQDELAARQLEQSASARQVAALQLELHQRVEAMQAIRRDIHQVALQTRRNEGGTLLRTLTREDVEGVVHLLNKSSISIGRGHECDIRLQSSSVSRYHAVLRMSHDAVIIEDMDSTNGCFVNGRRITRHLLKDGDMLKVGAVPLCFAIRAKQD